MSKTRKDFNQDVRSKDTKKQKKERDQKRIKNLERRLMRGDFDGELGVGESRR